MENVSYKAHSVKSKTRGLTPLAQKLYEHLDPVSWKKAEVLAKELRVRKAKIKGAKDELEEKGKIIIRYFRNGNRKNPKHEITKIGNPIYKHIRLAGLSLWNDLDRLSLIEMYLKSDWNILPFHNKQPAIRDTDAWLARYKTIERVLEYFHQRPELNVGMRVQGLTIIDLDCQEIPEYFCRARGFMDTLTAKTAKGYHFYFKHDPVVRTSTKTLDEKTDTRCEGSFIVLPPSVHESGFVYSWDNLALVRPLPIELRRMWRGNDFQAQQNRPNLLLSYEIPEGMRNDTLFRFGRSLKKQGMTKEEIAQELNHANHSRCNPNLSFSEMDRLIKHIWTYSDRE